MFDYCKLENKKCGFAVGDFCGLAIGQNRIDKIKVCPKGKKWLKKSRQTMAED